MCITERLPESTEPGALYEALRAAGEPEACAQVAELGRRAAGEGWARRFLLDVVHGRLRLSPRSAAHR